MKKRITALALAVFMVLGTVAAAAGAEKSITVSPMTLSINGQTVTPTKSNGAAAEVFAYDGATYVPLRYLSELLGIQVEWDKDNPNTAKLVNMPMKYTGTSVGMQGPVTVEMSVLDGKITGVAVTASKETAYLADVAMERIPAQMVEHQTTTVDTVTGATMASNAIMGGAPAPAKAAGLDMEALKANAYHAQPGQAETWDTDVLVIGGGGAGLSAAISAAQNGAKVTLIEKSSFLGGNTFMAGGAFNAVDPEAQATRILSQSEKNTLDSYLALTKNDKDLHFDLFPEWAAVLEQLQKDIKAFYAANPGKTPEKDMPGFDSISLHMWHIYTGGLRQMADGSWTASDIDLARTLAEGALAAYEWTGTLGTVKTASRAGAPLSTVLGAMWQRTHTHPTKETRILDLKNAAEKEGVVIYTETAGTELITNGGKVVGAKAQKADGTPITINTAKGVVLACGGYCANPAMVKEYDEYWGDNLSDRTLSTNAGTNTGDGIKMAMAIGADTVDLGVAQMMPSSSPLKGTMTDGIWADAAEQLWIGADGKRFVDEYAERDVLAKASMEQPDGIFYIIYAGSAMREGKDKCQGASYTAGGMGGTVQAMVEGGHIWYGKDLKELAEATKTPAGGATSSFTEEQLRTVIEQYNSYVEAQNDPDFHKGNLKGYIDLEYIESHDDVGICISPRKASLHHTMGGVKINTEAEVISTSGKAIPGLWAAGEVTGGIHAGNRLGGNAIADIFTFGQIAGKSAAGK